MSEVIFMPEAFRCWYDETRRGARPVQCCTFLAKAGEYGVEHPDLLLRSLVAAERVTRDPDDHRILTIVS